MSDIKLSTNGDLQLIKLSSSNNIVSDVAQERNMLPILLKRALLSPKGYITIYEIKNSELSLKDSNYGNSIYQELSEGITLNLLSRIKSHIVSAITEANLNQSVESIDLNVVEAHTIQILINYTNGSNNIIEINI